MIKVSRIVTPSPEQWDIMIRGIYNEYAEGGEPDSYITHVENPDTLNAAPFQFVLGDTDLAVMRILYNAGKRAFLSNLFVYIAITASAEFWLSHDCTPSKYSDTVVTIDYLRAVRMIQSARTPEDKALAEFLVHRLPYLADIAGL